MPDDERTKSLLAALHAPSLPPAALTNGDDKSETATLLPQPLTEDPIFSNSHHSPPPLAIPSSTPSAAHQRTLSTSPPISRRPVQQHRRTGSATVSSVLSSHAFPEAVTGVEVVRTLDLAERAERNRGPVVLEEEEGSEEDEEEDEGEAWGVRSEGDVRALLERSAPMPSISTFSSITDASPSLSTSASTSWKDRLPSRGTLSFDEPRSFLANGRRHVSDSTPTPSRTRSDSLTSLLPPSPSSARPNFARKAFSSSPGASINGRGRPSLHGRSTSELDGGKRREGWLSALGGRVEEGDEDGEEEARRKVVVVEVSPSVESRGFLKRRRLAEGERAAPNAS